MLLLLKGKWKGKFKFLACLFQLFSQRQSNAFVRSCDKRSLHFRQCKKTRNVPFSCLSAWLAWLFNWSFIWRAYFPDISPVLTFPSLLSLSLSPSCLPAWLAWLFNWSFIWRAYFPVISPVLTFPSPFPCPLPACLPDWLSYLTEVSFGALISPLYPLF